MTRIIKKYKNRRLYDTEISQYITIEDLQRYVIEGVDFSVEDAKGKDITTVVLLQIFVEMESGSTQFLSKDMLRQLIVASQHPMSQSYKDGLSKFFDTIGQSVQNNPYLKDYKKASDAWQKNTEEMFKQWKGFLDKF